MKKVYKYYTHLPEVLQKEIVSYGDPELYKKYKFVMNELEDFIYKLGKIKEDYCSKCLIGLIRDGYICHDRDNFEKCYSIHNSLNYIKTKEN